MTEKSRIAELIGDLDSIDMRVREQAKARLLEFGSAAVAPLIETLRSQSGSRSWGAADLLGHFDDPSCIQPLQEALYSSNLLVGHAAACSLEHYGEQAVSILVNALSNNHFLTKLQIVSVLERISSQRAVVPLMQLLQTTESPTMRYTIIQALGVLGDPQAVDLIRSFRDDEDHHVRKRVRIALKRLGAAAENDANDGYVDSGKGTQGA